MRMQAKKMVEAAQERDDILELGGDAVHVGYCAELDAELPHLATADGNVPIPEGAWLVREDGDFKVMSAADFAAAYTK